MVRLTLLTVLLLRHCMASRAVCERARRTRKYRIPQSVGHASNAPITDRPRARPTSTDTLSSWIRRFLAECQQMYAKVLGADHQETLDAALRAHTVGEEEDDEEEGGEGDRDEGEVEDKAGDK
jgi:hypothetical protein